MRCRNSTCYWKAVKHWDVVSNRFAAENEIDNWISNQIYHCSSLRAQLIFIYNSNTKINELLLVLFICLNKLMDSPMIYSYFVIVDLIRKTMAFT